MKSIKDYRGNADERRDGVEKEWWEDFQYQSIPGYGYTSTETGRTTLYIISIPYAFNPKSRLIVTDDEAAAMVIESALDYIRELKEDK